MTLAAAVRPFLIPALLAIVWQVASTSKWLNPVLFPPPTAIANTAWQMTVSGELPQQVLATLRRVLIGVFWGGLGGLMAGLLMGIWVPFRQVLDPLVSALHATPKLTLLPLLMLFLGVGQAAGILLIAIVAFIFVAVETLAGVGGLDGHYVAMAQNYGANRWALIRRVYVPGSLPHIFTGFRLAFSRGLVTAISVEMISGSDGLGSMIWLAWETLRTERLYVGVILAALLGIIAFRAAHSLERRAVPWQR